MGKYTHQRLILDLCGGYGGWSKPYAEDPHDRYHVVVVDPLAETDGRPNTTTIRGTVQDFYRQHVKSGLLRPGDVWGILAHPPCRVWAGSGARWWSGDKHKALVPQMQEIVWTCMHIIEETAPVWWALENPVGRIGRMTGLGRHSWTFQPYHYGEDYSKRTCIWGTAQMPEKTTPDNVPANKNRLSNLPPSKDRWRLRSMTPPGFALAFKEANK